LQDEVRDTVTIVNRFFSRRTWPVIICAVVVLLYFGYFVLPGLNARFNYDDPLNIYYFWSRGGGALARGLLFFFSTYYRPMGGVYFFSLYEVFGLNPFPYHVVITFLLLINLILAYRCASLLSGSRIVGAFCAVLMAYHANLASLVYLPAFVYDVLCFTFFFSALLYYLRIRCAGAELTPRQMLVFFLLYIGALESKEMAVSLPIMILAYEVFWHPPDRSLRKIVNWMHTRVLPALIAGLLTAIYIIGKSIGPDALRENLAYHSTITFGRFFDSNVRFFEDLFYLNRNSWFSAPWLMALWGMLAYAAWRRRENHLKWAVLFTVISPLPIAFIAGRGGAMLYIPWFGWALSVATFISAACNVLAHEPILKRLRPTLARALPLLLAVGLIWRATDSQNKNLPPRYERAGELFWSIKNQLATILPRVKPGAKIAFYNDIFETWDSKFIAELLYHDRSVTASLNSKTPLSLPQWAEIDYVLAYDQQKLVLLKRPGEAFMPPREFIKRPDVRIEATAAEIRAGKDSLALQTVNLNARAIDILYTLNGQDMPPVVEWQLNGNHTEPMLVGGTTPKGKYHIYAIRDSYNENQDQWIAVDLNILVR
jgi:hypothetical protein